jgi:hypothetical protein
MLCSMKSIFLVAITPFFIGSLFAQQPRARAPSIPTVETKWPGVNFAIYRVERIQDNRLLVWVRVIATSSAPPRGTILGERPPIPPSATKDDLATGRYNPRPFSLASSVMTDEQTQKKYSVLPPMVPPGKAYFPGELANGLRPGQAETLTIQFAAPPPPEEGNSSKQTVSFSLPGAKGPIANVPVPQPVVEK